MANTEKKSTFVMPHPIVLIYVLVILMVVLTWIVPAGEFQRVEKQVGDSTRLVALPETFHRVEAQRAGPEALLLSPIRGFQDGMLIIVFLFVIGGAFNVINESGAINLAIKKMAAAFSRHPRLQKFIIPALMLVFSLAGSVFGMCEETIPFILIFIPLAISLGYDSIVGVAIPFLGAAAGFAAAFFNPFTVGVAQGLSNLPLYSGLPYRLVAWVIGTSITIAFVMKYAATIKKNPEKSPVFDLDRGRAEIVSDGGPDLGQWNWRHRGVLAVFGLGIVLLVLGILIQHWYIEEIAALFLAMGLVAGFVAGQGPSRIARNFIAGARDFIGVAFVIACGRAILIVAQDAKILDTLLYYASDFISVFPRIVTAQMMFLTQSVINFFVHSGTAQAALTMPIMAPLSDLVHVTRQTTVFAFQLCEFINPILPTSAVTMGVLGMARIPWDKWARWFLPLMMILMALSMLLLIPPVLMNWGPF
ncbi:MAG: putative basic amino acid antiporter YfcC [Candidatus Aminicenantes bacterium]|nr:putative basic amino acid antiporter YfcC [Candidatus Aminicenantes bacterium]